MIGMGLGLGFATGGMWTPTRLSGIALWLRADANITLVSGKVSAWGDMSGSGDAAKVAVQATAGNRPTVTTANGNYNGQSTIDFAVASTQWLRTGTWASPLSAPFTIIAVGNDDGTASQQIYVDKETGGFCFFGNDGVGHYNFFAGSNISGGVASNAPSLIVGVADGSSSALYRNAKTPIATGSIGTPTLTGMSLGISSSTSGPINGSIAEIIVKAGAITAAELSALSTYVTSRYAIAIGT